MIKWVHLRNARLAGQPSINKIYSELLLFSRYVCPTLFDPIDCTLLGSSVLGFPRQEYWSGSSCPPPGDLPTVGLNPHFLCLLHWQADSLPPGKPRYVYFIAIKVIEKKKKIGLLSLRSLGKNNGVGSHPLLQGICPTQGSNSGLPCCRWILHCLSHQRGPEISPIIR